MSKEKIKYLKHHSITARCYRKHLSHSSCLCGFFIGYPLSPYPHWTKPSSIVHWTYKITPDPSRTKAKHQNSAKVQSGKSSISFFPPEWIYAPLLLTSLPCLLTQLGKETAGLYPSSPAQMGKDHNSGRQRKNWRTSPRWTNTAQTST